ncbi:MAG: Omp28-related outer membrane protein [Chitinivibrionales bacterium]|nr:Omp28-related outer membrane protein [Chitinivibrionales bacterium]
MLSYHCNVSSKPEKNDLLTNEDSKKRMEFYGFQYVPYATLNGVSAGNNFNVKAITNQKIQEAYQKPAYLNFSVQGIQTQLNPHACSIAVTIQALADYSSKSSLVLFTAIIEDSINYKTLFGIPAENGRNEYSHVVRKLLPSANGTVIGNLTKGTTIPQKFVYTNEEKTQKHTNLRVVVFVQDMASKDIIGAFQSKSHPFQEPTSVNRKPGTKNRAVDARIVSITPHRICFDALRKGLYSVSVYSVSGQNVYNKTEKINSPSTVALAFHPTKLSLGVYVVSIAYNGVGVLEGKFTIK